MNQVTAKPRYPAALAVTIILLIGGLSFAASAEASPSCPRGAQCGTVTVPLDRTNHVPGTIDIAYALVPRTDTSRPSLGTVVPNPGGPGQTTIGSAGIYLGALAPLRSRRDLLLIDPRGTGQSGALSCPSLASEDPLTLDSTRIGELCGSDLGARAGLYGSADVADDIDAVRAALGLDKLDLWGDSYGTFLMPVYAALHPGHVRSIVLDGAFPIASDPWGRDVLRGMRRVIGLVCKRSHRCSGPRVLAQIERLSRRLREHPLSFAAQSPVGTVDLTLGERELANVTYGGGHPEVYGYLPAAVQAALHGDYALLERLVTVSRVSEVGELFIDPSLFSVAAASATSCHDYPRPYDLADPPADRLAEYEGGLAALDPSDFRPFSADAWLDTEIDAGPKCLGWPADSAAGSPLMGQPMPDVPVLVQSGDLDADTPVEQGRRAAAQFAHPTFAIVANAGHTPDLQPCGVAMAIEFVKHLHTDRNSCRHNGEPPKVVGRPALLAAQLRGHIRAAGPVRRVVRVALATIADARRIATYSGMTDQLDALRGGVYDVSARRVRFIDAQVVTDAAADGTQTKRGRVTLTRLRLRGRGVAASKLTLRSSAGTTRITGSVGGHRVAVSAVRP
jgi:pimeloyl-ACP methyl ester carboxylesterase